MKYIYMILLSSLFALPNTVFGIFREWKTIPNQVYNIVALNNEGTLCATFTSRNTIGLWSTYTGKKKLSFKVSNNAQFFAEALSFSPNSKFLAVASSENNATVWNTDTGKLHISLKGHSDEVSHIAFSSDGSKIITSSLDGSAIIWSAINGKIEKKFSLENPEPIKFVAISNDNTQLITVSHTSEKDITLWDTESMESISFDLENAAKSASFNNSGNKIIISFEQKNSTNHNFTKNSESTAAIIDLMDLSIKTLKNKYPASIKSAFFAPNDFAIITTDDMSNIALWDPQTQKIVDSLPQIGSGVEQASISNDLTTLVSITGENIVTIWVSQINKKCADN